MRNATKRSIFLRAGKKIRKKKTLVRYGFADGLPGLNARKTDSKQINIVCEGGTPFGEDENEEGIVSLSPVNTEEELDMLLAHVLGDDGGGADD